MRPARLVSHAVLYTTCLDLKLGLRSNGRDREVEIVELRLNMLLTKLEIFKEKVGFSPT